MPVVGRAAITDDEDFKEFAVSERFSSAFIFWKIQLTFDWQGFLKTVPLVDRFWPLSSSSSNHLFFYKWLHVLLPRMNEENNYEYEARGCY